MQAFLAGVESWHGHQVQFFCPVCHLHSASNECLQLAEAAAARDVARVKELIAEVPGAAKRNFFVFRIDTDPRNELVQLDGYVLPPIAHAVRRAKSFFAAEAKAGSDEERNQIEIIGALVAAKADVNTAGHNGGVALHFADTPNVVTALVEAKANLNSATESGWAALHRAAGYKDDTLVRALLRHGADPNKISGKGNTPLRWAVRRSVAPNSDVERNVLAIVSALVESKAHVNHRNKDSDCPLHFAATAALANALINARADVDPAEAGYYTPLHAAAADGRVDVVRTLLRHGANPSRAAVRLSGTSTPKRQCLALLYLVSFAIFILRSLN